MATVLAQQSFGTGRHQTPSVPTTLVSDGLIVVTAIMNSTDLVDTAINMSLGIDFNDASTAQPNDPNWYTLATTWHGGLSAKTGLPLPPPSVSWETSAMTAQRVRAFVDLTFTSTRTTCSIGLDVTVTPP